jgi:FtsH-binding integral membrane protein
MNYVVLALSAIGHIAHFKPLSFVENLLAMLLFGLIIASIANRFGIGTPPRAAAL